MTLKGGARKKITMLHFKTKEAFRKASAFRHIHIEERRGHKHRFIPFRIGRGPIHYRCEHCGKRK